MKRVSAGFWRQRSTAGRTRWTSSMPRSLQKKDPDKIGLVKGEYMQHECKITVLETKVFPDLQEKYLADPS